jgi:hypothetical protein
MNIAEQTVAEKNKAIMARQLGFEIHAVQNLVHTRG